VKADPASVKWGGSAGGTDHILVGLLAKAAGIDPKAAKYVPYSGGGETKAALLSGDLGVAVSSVSEFKDLIAAGQLRALGISSNKPFEVDGKKIPTLKEGGYDLELMNWRGVVAAPGISDAERSAISTLVDKLHSSAQWKQALTDQGWDDFYKTGEEATSFFQNETTRITAVLTEIGLVSSCP
jgi:putative tricarboxylic transport membrane protein